MSCCLPQHQITPTGPFVLCLSTPALLAVTRSLFFVQTLIQNIAAAVFDFDDESTRFVWELLKFHAKVLNDIGISSSEPSLNESPQNAA
jgi:uncharacterized protein YjiS (DUF1127 family)